MGDQPKTLSAVETPGKMKRLRNSVIRSRNYRTVYVARKFLKGISEQTAHFSNMNAHIK